MFRTYSARYLMLSEYSPRAWFTPGGVCAVYPPYSRWVCGYHEHSLPSMKKTPTTRLMMQYLGRCASRAAAPLAIALGLLGSAPVAAQAQGKSATEKVADQSLDHITRVVKKKYGRVLAISRGADGRVKAKILTADGRVRHLDLDPGKL